MSHAARSLPETPAPPPTAFAIPTERLTLPNGLVVLLSPDPSVASVAVTMSFAAGTEYEPAQRSGLAHLVEHVMAIGPTPETDYAGILERRGAVKFNGFTTYDSLRYEVVLPAAQLPVALWAFADRLGTLPALIDAAAVEKSRRIVFQERALVLADQPFGLVDEIVAKDLYPAPHPLHGGVLGVESELATATVADIHDYVSKYLVPANAVLTVVGNFDPKVVKPLLQDTLGLLPGGTRAQPPAIAPMEPSGAVVDKHPEVHSRVPRVTVAWRFPSQVIAAATTLELGAYLLNVQTDGAWGMRIDADFVQYAGESTFRFDLVLPYAETMDAAQSDATSFVRFLTRREANVELMQLANLALDRANLMMLDTLDGRASALTRLERLYGDMKPEDYFSEHWRVDNFTVRDTARACLSGPGVVIHARPIHPRPPRGERE
ncbi:MAG: insulinase family protein [Deltaproteobacteria bacterium]|nr:insulinase family protein [Deltaproteobacteria bacterium]